MATGYIAPWGKTFDSRGFTNYVTSQTVLSGGGMSQSFKTIYLLTYSGSYCTGRWYSTSNDAYNDKGFSKGGTVYQLYTYSDSTSAGFGFKQAGSIEAATYYSVNVINQTPTYGSVSGGGNCWPSDKVKILATPNEGYYISQIGQTGYKSLESLAIDYQPTSDANVYVVFDKCHNICFYHNDGTLNQSTKYILPGEKITIDYSVIRENYVFVGWSLTKDGPVIYKANESFTPSSDINLYAIWSPMFTIAFDANGGVGTMPIQECVGNDGKKVSANAFTREGRFFVNWNTKANGSGVSYDDGCEVSEIEAAGGEEITLYAQWRYPNVRIFKDNIQTGGVAPTGVGEIKVIHEGVVVATLSDDESYFEATKGERYIIRLDFAGSTKDKLWRIKGVNSNGSYLSSYSFLKGDDDVNIIYWMEKKKLYSVVYDIITQGSSAEIITPIDEDGKFVEGSDVVIKCIPATHYKVSSVNFYNTDTGLPEGDGVYDVDDNLFTIRNLSFNVSAHINFSLKEYTLNARIDDASAVAINNVKIVREDGSGEYEVDKVYSGEQVKLIADVKEGYVKTIFTDLTTGKSYGVNDSFTVLHDCEFVVTTSVSINVEVVARNNGGTLPSNNPTITTSGIISGAVQLGKSFTFKILLRGWLFNAWFDKDDENMEYPLPYGVEDSIYPTKSLNIVADVTSSLITNTLNIRVKNEETGEFADATSENIISIAPTPYSSNTDIEGYHYTYKGTTSIVLSAIAEIASGATFSHYEVNGVIECESQLFNTYANGGTKNVIAVYSPEGERETKIGYVNGKGDRSIGYIAIDGVECEDKTMSSIKQRGEYITITAKPRNGYKFIGWFSSQTGIGSPVLTASNIEFKVNTNKEFYAYFEKDTNAVYEWEGSSENKMMTWKSKVYVSPRPFNPSCCRVDTEGYPLEKLGIEMFSSPDNKATVNVELTNVKSQSPRRLPIRRSERYIQICIENDKEVDAVNISTSMGGLV